MSDRLEAVEGFWRLGFSVIPFWVGSKPLAVAWKNHQKRRHTP